MKEEFLSPSLSKNYSGINSSEQDVMYILEGELQIPEINKCRQ